MRGHRLAPRPAATERVSRMPVPVVLDLHRAACAGHPTPQLWDRIVDGESKTQRLRRRCAAADICSGCPERRGCPDMVRPPAQRQRNRAKATATHRCPECGTGFAPRDRRQRFCATKQPSCRRVAQNRERALQRRDAGVSASAATCPCGAALTAEQQQRRVKYHDPECKRRAVNRRAVAYRAGHRAPARPAVRCERPGCAVEFVPLNSRHRYHDQRCGDQAIVARRSRRRAEHRALQRTAVAANLLPPVRCGRCPAVFTPRDFRHRYCSRSCSRANANQRRLARHRATAPPRPPVDRRAVLAVIHGRAPLKSLPLEHQWLPVRYLRRRDMSVRAIAARVHAGHTIVHRILARAA